MKLPLLAALACLCCPSPTHADTCTWDGSDGNWSEGARWSCGHPPGVGDTVVINGGTVRVDAARWIGSLTLNGGILNSASTLTVTDTMIWTAGTITGWGTTTIALGATLRIEGPGAGKFLGGGHTLRNEGTVSWQGGRITSVANEYATIENNGRFDLYLFSSGGLVDAGGSGGRVFDNVTMLNHDVEGIGVTFTDMQWQFNNRGSVNVRSGELNLLGGGTHSGDFDVSTGATLRFRGSTNTLNAGASLGGLGSVEVPDGTLDVAADMSVNGTLSLGLAGPASVGLLTGQGTLTVLGTMTWLSGTMSGTGTTKIAPGATLNIVGEGYVTLGGGRTLHNGGTVNCKGQIDSTQSESATIQNEAWFSLRPESGLLTLVDRGGSGRRVFNNVGILSHAAQPDLRSIGWLLNNTGDVVVSGGRLRLTGGGTHSGTFLCGSFLSYTNAEVEFSDGTNTLSAGTSLRGDGSFVQAHGTLVVSADVGVEGRFRLEDYGRLEGSGTLTILGTMDWSRGSMKGTGVTEIAPGATLTIAANPEVYLSDARTLRNNGTVNWIGGTISSWPGDSPRLWNHGTLNLTGELSLPDPGAPGNRVVNNLGTLNCTNAAQVATIGWPVTNSGTIIVSDGALRFTNAFTQTTAELRVHHGTLAFTQPLNLQAGLLGGWGIVEADVTNTGGILAPGASPGRLTLIGDYTQGAGGTLDLQIGGLDPVAEFDQLNVTGTATLGGTLQLSPYGGFSPASGDSFQIIQFASGGGTFASVKGWQRSRGGVFRVNYDTNNVTLTVAGGPTTRVSIASNGTQAIYGASYPSISADGRYIAMNASFSTSPDSATVFVHDRQTGLMAGFRGLVYFNALSANGRSLALEGDHLVPADTNGWTDIYRVDVQNGEATWVSVPSDSASASPSISGDGHTVAFCRNHYWYNSFENVWERVFSLHVGSGLASARPDGRPVFCNNPAALSADGRFAAFLVGEEVVTGVPSSTAIIAVRDMQTGQTTVASVASDGTTATNGFFGGFCSMSADGRYVAFASTAANLVPDKTSPWYDVFVHDRQTRETTRVSLAWDGLQGAGDSYNPSLSADGRFVAFESSAPNLVTGDSNNFKDVFVHDRRTGQTTRVSLADNGAQGNAGSGSPALSGDGRFVAFVSRASNLVSDDTNGQDDVFVHDRVGDTAPEVQAVPQSDGSLTIEWWDESVLYSTDRIGGSWTPDLEARSPFKVTPDAPQRFFRLQRPSAGGSPGR